MSSQQLRYPFWFGGSASCMAACVTHPLDLIKVRLQAQAGINSPGLVDVCTGIFKQEGLSGFYRGLSASLVRQATYSTIRFAVYEDVKQRVGPSPDAFVLGIIAACSGFAGGLAGNFADVVNVRMQNDSALPEARRKNYRNIFDGVIRIVREEGAASLMKGWMANCTRATAQTTAQLATYDVIKRYLMEHTGLQGEWSSQLTASFLAGLVATTVTNPIDVIKTRIMSTSEAEGLFAVVRTSFQKDGLGWMFRGWLPSFSRIGPHTVCIFLFLEMHRQLYRQWREDMAMS